MKILFRILLLTSVIVANLLTAHGQTTFTLNLLNTFGTGASGTNTAGYIQPGESLGLSPINGNNVKVSAQGFGVQPGDAPPSTNGFNMRGLAFDPVSGNLVLVDTHGGSGGSLGSIMPTNSAIYILDPNTGQILGALNTNGIVGGNGVGTVAAVGVADDGVVYVASQINSSTAAGFKIYRWPTANTADSSAFTNSPSGKVSVAVPIVAFTNTLSPTDRIGQTIDVRGAGTNTQIIIGTSALTAPATGTNVYLFTTADGTNFTSHRLSIPGLTNVVLNDGIAFGVSNTFWAKQVGQPLYFMSFETTTFTGSIIVTYKASGPSDPILNLSAISVDPVNHLLAGLEETGGNNNGGRGKLWLFDIPFPSNTPPAVLASQPDLPNFIKATAPMGYLDIGNGRIYANIVNNGLMATTIDVTGLGPPTFVLNLPATTRALSNSTAHFEVQAVVDVTNYQWYSNNVPIVGARTYYLDMPNVQPSMSGITFKVTVINAAGTATSADSMLTVVDPAGFFHLNPLWTRVATNLALPTDLTNYITSSGTAGAPNERSMAFNALSNQLLVVRGPGGGGAGGYPSMRIFVVDADTGTFLYNLKTNGLALTPTLNLCGIGVADDGAVYACNVNSATQGDQTYKIYRWADSGSNTLPQVIFGTNSSAATANPIDNQTGTTFRFGDTLAVHGSGLDTEIVIDSQNSAKYAAVLHPKDDTMTNWASLGFLLKNDPGSYGTEIYGTTIGRSVQFGPIEPGPFGPYPTFWQKRYNGIAGAPLACMGYDSGGGVAPLQLANLTSPLFTNGPVGINFTLKVAAAINFVGAVASDSTTAADTLNYYDLTDPTQALLLFSPTLPGGAGGLHKGNTSAIGQVIFGVNQTTATNYVFVLNGNNGITAFVLAGGSIPPPQIIAQPKNLRILEGTTAGMTATADQPVTMAWYKGTNTPVDTGVRGSAFTIANATGSAGGDYFAVANNLNGSVTTRVAHVTVGLTNDNYTLSQVWAAGHDNPSFPYVTFGTANAPNERSFAYNALSNQLIIVKCPANSTAYTNWVVDAATGTLLYTLNTAGIIHNGQGVVNSQNSIDEVGATAAEDGAIYIASESPTASGTLSADTTKMMHIYRWADSGPNTVPVNIFQGDPSSQPASVDVRWGDVISARGTGTNTELIMNAWDQSYGALLKPIDTTMASFTNYPFLDVAGSGSIGRSLQFGPTNTVFEKRKGSSLYYSSYVTNGSASLLLTVDSTTTLGGVAVDALHNLAIGVDFIGSATKPDAVSLYDISDTSSPMLIKQYNFPSNQVANANVICQTIIASNYVYSMDANNGLMKFVINPPVNSMILHISNSAPNVTLSWGNQFAVLQGTPTMNPPVWADLTVPPVTNSVRAATTNTFYRLIQRR